MAEKSRLRDTMSDVKPLEDLQSAITRTGYYPELVSDAIHTALAGEQLQSFVLHHETTFDHNQLHRHLTVVALTGTRLVVSHTDEHSADENRPFPSATTSTEAVRLKAIASVVIQRVVSEPALYPASSAVQEVVITIGWGAVNRIDLGPAACEDPNCEAEHGFSGTSVNDDLTIRVSLAADGALMVEQALQFASALSEVTSNIHAPQA